MTTSTTITVEQMVQREVMCCMSSMVSALASGYDCISGHGTAALTDICEQAFELSCPVTDYEEAADQANLTRTGDGQCLDLHNVLHHDARAACEANDIEPYEWEVFEHWAVSSWLAEKLIAQGKRVDTDFAGFNVWARTCTGQAISMDGCIRRIYADMVGSH